MNKELNIKSKTESFMSRHKVPIMHTCEHITYKNKPVTKTKIKELEKEECLKCKLKYMLEESEAIH